MMISRSDQFSPNLERGTEELRSKHHVEIEPIDYRGLMRRARVTDQTALDALFLRSVITAPQHCAGDCLLEVIVRSGGTARSSDPSSVSFGSLRDAEKAMSSRIMVASGAYRALKRAGEDASKVTLSVVSNNHLVKGNLLLCLRLGLDELVRYFGTYGVKDPRGGGR